MRRMTRRRQAALAIVLALIVGVGLGSFLPPNDDFFALRKNFAIFGKLYEELSMGYVDRVDPDQLMRAGIDAMLETLDPYTVYIDEADNEDIGIITRGRYGGVGLSVGRRAGSLVVVEPIEGYSAFEQGVRTGDAILTIEGMDASDLAPEELSQLLRGEPGTTVRIEVGREGVPAPLPFVLTRARVQLQNVGYKGFVEDGIGLVRLDRFTRGAGREVAEAIDSLAAEQALRGLVLDLRGNPGGLLEEAVSLSGIFLPSGSLVVATRGRAPESEREFRSQAPPSAPDLPLVVLVDGSSASAAEIVAGALQDHDRAVVIGERTFGKGLVQSIRPLPYHTSLKLTISQYYIPSGRSIQAIAYSRDATGARVEAVPDSLRRAFETAAGRTVYDGRGIEPDETVGFGEVSELEQALLRHAAFFLYANHFVAEQPEVAPDFRVTGETMADFQRWLGEEDFSFTTRAEYQIDELEDELHEIDYEAADQTIAALRRALADEKSTDFERHAPRLRERLRREILSRALTQTAQFEASFRDDPQLTRARDVLGDADEYRRFLSPR